MSTSNHSSVHYEVSTAPKWLRQYVVGDVVGEGCYGKVKEAVDVLTRERVAIKIMKRVVVKKIRGGEAAVQREIEILKRCVDDAPALLHLVEAWFDADKAKTYLVTRFVDGESLAALVARLDKAEHSRLPVAQVQHYFRQVFAGVECLHKHSIAHRDLKPDNIMLGAASHAVTLIDFGVALVVGLHDAASAASGSAAYQPPEKMTSPDSASDFDADVWALGLCLYQACTGAHPFELCAPSAMFDRIARADIDFAPVTDDSMRAVLHKLLAPDPKLRCSARWARKHAFDSDLRVSSRRMRKQFVAVGAVPSAFSPADLDDLEAQYRREHGLSERSGDAAVTATTTNDDSDGGGGGGGGAVDDDDDDVDWQPRGRHSIPQTPRDLATVTAAAAAAATTTTTTTPASVPHNDSSGGRKKKNTCVIQ